jgi:hypothetical protein
LDLPELQVKIKEKGREERRGEEKKRGEILMRCGLTIAPGWRE